eukprot:1570321-Pyramimonas_sp.AAC.1
MVQAVSPSSDPDTVEEGQAKLSPRDERRSSPERDSSSTYQTQPACAPTEPTAFATAAADDRA